MKNIPVFILFSLFQINLFSQQLMTNEAVTETIHRMGDLLEKNFVFPEKATAMKKMLQENLAKGSYFKLTLEEFATVVYKDLQVISPDKHMRVDVFPERPLANNGSLQVQHGKNPQKINPFKKIEFLPGNVAWVVLDNFPNPATCDDYVISTMNSISSAKAVIFDLRNNGGGSPLLVQLMLSYLLEPKTHYNSVFNRIKNTISEYRTYQINTFFESEGGTGPDNKEGKLNGKLNSFGLIKAPVYVLTSKRTFSAAEEFAYDIQSIKRGKIVGNSTAGGAHQMNGFGVYGRIGMLIPYTRPINPYTGTDWEGTGVKPDIEVHVNDALKTAHGDALKTLKDIETTSEGKLNYDWIIRLSEYYYKSPAPLTDAEMKNISGNYGKDVRIFIEGVDLVAEVDMGGVRRFKLQQLDDLIFKVDSDIIVVFSKDASGKIKSAEAVYKNGQSELRQKVQ